MVSSFEESATLLLSGKAKKLSQQGRSIINFGVGEPDFNTPEAIIEKAYSAAKEGQTKYTAVAGIPSLRKAVADRLKADYQVDFNSADEVLISSGGKQAIYHFLQAILEPGDEVLIPAPYWVSFPEMVKLVGGKPVIVASKGERMTAEDIRPLITKKTRLLILNSPSNPSGMVYTKEELASYLKVIESHPIWLMSDDTYYKLVYSPSEWSSVLKIRPDFRSRTCIIGSSSKTYAMTGWRLGWAVAPKPIIDAMIKLQSQVTSSACSLSQVAAEAALTTFHASSDEFHQRFSKRRDFIYEKALKIKGLKPIKPEGAFYLFVNFSEALKGRPVAEYAEELLEKHGVCVIPGVAFGAPDYARLSYALSEADIEEGLKRIQKSLEK
ncbi:MAG: Aminotransferase [Bacteriovoracaceae bacterium]|nr:Aminotransferase [Bacteriovoracaceae bacterium]